jgi:hypothetical protein
MDVWEQKLELAESIAGYKFTEDQANVFAEDNRDLAFFFFHKREGQTTVGITYALVSAYWKPNIKCLYIADDGNAVAHSKTLAATLAKNFSKCRPERTYQIVDGHVQIGFGETKSEVKFHTLSAYHVGEDYDAIIVDTSYHSLRMKHITKFTNTVSPSGKLLIMSQVDGETKLPTTQNKLDAIMEDVAMSCE